MKKYTYLLSAVFALFLASCSKDENKEIVSALPVIQHVEIGLNNSKKAYTESDLHLEAEIVAEAGIKKVEVQITPKVDGPSTFMIVESYTTKFLNKKEAELHEHYDVPKNAKEGEYSVVIIVIDQLDRKVTYEDTLTIEKDPSLPTATERLASYDSNILSVKATIKAPNKLASVVVKVKDIEQKFEDTDLVGQTEYAFDKQIDVTSLNNGHYHFFVTITDQAGKVFSYEGHFDKK